MDSDILLPGDIICSKEDNRYYIIRKIIVVSNEKILIHPLLNFKHYLTFTKESVKLCYRDERIDKILNERISNNFSNICKYYCKMRSYGGCYEDCPNYDNRINIDKDTDILLLRDKCDIKIKNFLINKENKDLSDKLINNVMISGIKLNIKNEIYYLNKLRGGDKVFLEYLTDLVKKILNESEEFFSYSYIWDNSSIENNYLPRNRFILRDLKDSHYCNKDILINKICSICILNKEECNNCKIN